MDRNKLKNILNVLSPDGTATDFSEFDANVAKLKESLKQKIQAQTLDDVLVQFNAFKKSLNFTPLFDSINNIEKVIGDKIENVTLVLKQETTDFQKLLKDNNGVYDDKVSGVSNSIQSLRNELLTLNAQREGEVQVVRNRVDGLTMVTKGIDALSKRLQQTIDDDNTQDEVAKKEATKQLTDEIEKLRRELSNRINNIPRGGSANRNIAIGGNTSVLSTYTDINLKAGTNVTITYAKNQTTKYTDVTISATGGGGGSVRSINSISASQTAAAVAGTDYVYLCSGTITLTMPDPTTNTNMYTIKNVGTGTVTVDTLGGIYLIDNSSTAVMPVRYTSIDLISDTANWNIT